MNATRLVQAFGGAVFGRFHKMARRTPAREVRLRPIVEALVPEHLESRCLLSYSFSGGVLTFNGTNNDDTIIAYRVVNMSGDNVYVHRNDTTPEIAGPYPSSGAGSVTKVVINGALGDDNIYAELTGWFNHGNTDFVEVMEIHGDNGVDTLKGGNGADTIQGEGGNDQLFGYGGDDSLHGGYAGDDTADSNGNDTLTGGSGTDQMYGGPGNDWFDSSDGLANDYSNGGPGDDNILASDSGDTFEL
jgi:Ca2+-binding RTX toxin-like protein